MENITRCSIVLPVHNEAPVLKLTMSRLETASAELRVLGYECDFVFVNDGSTDGSAELLDELALKENVRVVHLTRNVGHQSAVSAGLSFVDADVVAAMDADLQDPPEVLPEFLERWRNGAQVVYAIRRNRKEGSLKKSAYWLFYRVLNAVSDLDIPLDSGDFCVMDRSAVELINRLPENQWFVRRLRTWIGLKQEGVEYERAPRAAGTPSYSFHALLKLAIEGLVSFSALPLRLVTVAGIVGAVLQLRWVPGLFMRPCRVPRLHGDGRQSRAWSSAVHPSRCSFSVSSASTYQESS